MVQSKQNLQDGQIKHHEHIHWVRVWVWYVVGVGVEGMEVCLCVCWGGGGTYSSLRYLKNGAATVMMVSIKPG